MSERRRLGRVAGAIGRRGLQSGHSQHDGFLTMAALICGSMAFDTIMVFHSQFKKHILPEQIHILNVSFFVPEMRREFGGCAGNIAIR